MFESSCMNVFVYVYATEKFMIQTIYMYNMYTCKDNRCIYVCVCVSLSFVPVVLSPSFVFLVSWSLDLMFCKCTYWDPRITTLRVVSSYMALVYVTALQALIWFAVAWKSVGNHFTLAVYTFLKSDKQEKKHAETNTDILVLFINVCEFVCVCSLTGVHISVLFKPPSYYVFSRAKLLLNEKHLFNRLTVLF